MREEIDLRSYHLENNPTNIKKELCWKVFYENVNSKKIVAVNIFEFNWVCTNKLIDIYKEYKSKGMEFNVFEEQVRRAIMHEYWSRCEYETVITSWPPRISNDELNRLNKEREEDLAKGYKFVLPSCNLDTSIKIDIYTQIMLNWEHFINYLWDNKELIKKLKKVK